jgi:UDP-3-O-[3-hydroxymyristoyl] N-acetylglucosamine deacetylase
VGKRPEKDAAEPEALEPRFARMQRQKTLRHVIGCSGVGLHSGARVGLTLRPGVEGSGIRFRRVDRPGSAPIPANVDRVLDGPVGTSLGVRPGVGVRMVERLMAALAACEITNALVEISGPELPAMDGSALPFVRLIECAGTVEQDEPVPTLEVLRPVRVAAGGVTARLEPADGLELVIEGRPDAGPAPSFRFTFSPEATKRDLVPARSTAESAGDDRFADEPVRREALHALGDLALIPARLEARYVDQAAGPALRRVLLRELLADRTAWRLTGPFPAMAAVQPAPARAFVA